MTLSFAPSSPGPILGGSTPTGAGVGVASAQILGVNSTRKGITLINDSVNIIYLSKTDPARLNTGIRLNPNGGSYVEPGPSGNVWKGEWYGIATAAASNLCVLEEW